MIAESVVHYNDVLALAYRLTPLEKIKLVQQLANALEHESVLTTDILHPTASPSSPIWGMQVLTLLDSFDTNDWQTIEMPDVVDWVKQLRVQQDRQLGILWENVQ